MIDNSDAVENYLREKEERIIKHLPKGSSGKELTCYSKNGKEVYCIGGVPFLELGPLEVTEVKKDDRYVLTYSQSVRVRK